MQQDAGRSCNSVVGDYGGPRQSEHNHIAVYINPGIPWHSSPERCIFRATLKLNPAGWCLTSRGRRAVTRTNWLASETQSRATTKGQGCLPVLKDILVLGTGEVSTILQMTTESLTARYPGGAFTGSAHVPAHCQGLWPQNWSWGGGRGIRGGWQRCNVGYSLDEENLLLTA